MAKNLMIQGTGSSVGKSIITAALCRIFLQDGRSVAPFKSQNMALNSFATREGLEMGRAQVVQAQACRIEPSVLMNPILLKPTTDRQAQVIINGRVHGAMDARAYHDYKREVRPIVRRAYEELSARYDVIVIEGAGSPAEINLRDNDIVNMGMAELADAPVVLVADIDRGGVFASVVGTMHLLRGEERSRVRGVIINKFRGDIALLRPGIVLLEEMIGVPVLGVVPYMKIALEDEDSVTDRFDEDGPRGEIDIAIVRLPHISNFTDFDALRLHADVSLRFVERAADIGRPDILIVPGSKNTIGDMRFVTGGGIGEKIRELRREGALIVGICAGFQMLGSSIEDPHNVEGAGDGIAGLGLLDLKTVLEREKITGQVRGEVLRGDGPLRGLEGSVIEGYEIHMGRSGGDIDRHCFVRTENGSAGAYRDGVLGTYIHGIFDNTAFTRGLLNNIRRAKGLPPVGNGVTFAENRETEFNRLARAVRESLDMGKIYSIVDGAR